MPFHELLEQESDTSSPVETVPLDAMIRVFTNQETGESAYEMISRSTFKKKTLMNSELVDWLNELQDLLNNHHLLPDEVLKIHTRIKRADQSWRGHPNYHGLGPWRDWTWVQYDLPTHNVLCHIWCFVRIPDMKGKRLRYGGILLKKYIWCC